jgi:hypothetical protein
MQQISTCLQDYAKSARGITDPELVVPTTAHAAFDKGKLFLPAPLVYNVYVII